MVLAAARAVLAGVFLFAAVAKVHDRAGTRRALVDFRVPHQVVGLVAWILPATELVIAVGLLAPRSARLAAGAGFVLLLAFDVVVVQALRAGSAPACACFGQVSARPVTRRTLLRNVVLGVLALAIALGSDPIEIWDGRAPGWVVLALVGGLVAVIVVWRQPTTRAAAAPDADQPVDEVDASEPVRVDGASVALMGRDGVVRGLDELLQGTEETVIVGTAPGCGPCRSLVPRVRTWQRSLAEDVGVVVVQWGRVGDLPDDADGAVWAVDDRAFARLGFRQTPSAVTLRRDGTVVDAVAAGSEAVEVLVRRALRRVEAR